MPASVHCCRQSGVLPPAPEHGHRPAARLAGLSHLTWLGFLSRDVVLAARMHHMHEGEAVPGQCLQLDTRQGAYEALFSDEGTRCAAASPDGRVVAVASD